MRFHQLPQLILATLLLLLTSPAHSYRSGSNPLCHYGTGFADGCFGAPTFTNSTLNFQDRTAFSDGTLFQVGQMPTGSGFTAGRNNLILWNIPGVDYAVGVAQAIYCNGSTLPCSTATGATTLIDANVYFTNLVTNHTDPAGTGCSTTSSTYTSGLIICKTAASVINISGFDFSPIISASQTCIPFEITSSGTAFSSGTFNFTNNHYIQTNTAACLSPAAGAIIRLGVSTTQAWAANILNNYIDLQSTQSYMLNEDAIGIQVQGTGAATVSYNYFGNMPTKAITTQNCATALDFNVWHNDGFDYGHALHTEFDLISGVSGCPAANQSVVGNLIWQDTTLPSPPTAYLIDAVLGVGTADPIVGYPELLTGNYQYNIAITNPTTDDAGNTSWYSEVNGDSFPVPSGGSGYNIGDLVQINITYGASLPCRQPPTVLVSTTGAGGSIATDQIWQAGSCLSGSSPPSAGTYTSTALTGTGSGATFTVNSWSNATTSAGFGFAGSGTLGVSGGQSYQNLTIANNAMDLSGMLGCQSNGPNCTEALNGHPLSIIYCANPANFFNNFNILNNITLPAPTPLSGC